MFKNRIIFYHENYSDLLKFVNWLFILIINFNQKNIKIKIEIY